MAKILIIDDNATNRKVLATLLEHEGHHILEASDGADGLAAVRAQRPNLVMSDILMPTMDGYEFVRQLRVDPDISATPVIFHTAHYHEREARNLAKICNVQHVLSKPAKRAEIIAAVERVLSGQAASTPPPDEYFDRQHLRLVTNKLSDKIDELSAANARLGTLIALNVQLASERDPGVLLEKVCHAARDLLGARFAVLVVGGTKPTFVTSGIDLSRISLETPRLDTGELAAVARERRTVRLLQDVGLPASYPRARAFVAAPVCSLTRSYGWICLGDKTGAEEFSAEDEHLLGTLGAQVGRIYENGSLYREIQAHANELQHLNRVYAVLSGINTLIVRVQDRQHLLDGSARLAVENGHFRFAWCGWLEPGAKTFRHCAWAGDSSELALMIPTTSLVAAAMQARHPRVFHDCLNEPLLAPLHSEIGALGYQSIIALPLVVEGEPVGCLVLATHEHGFFDAQELRLLTELAGDISFALDHIGKAERLNYLAFHDELTGLANRAFFHEQLNIHVSSAARSEHKLALVVAQVERLESVGETFGRHAADQLIRELGARLRDCVHNPVARVGSDTFALIVPGIADEADVVRVLDRTWVEWLAPALEIDGNELRLAANAGIALYPTDGADANTLMKHAQAALKKARKTNDRYLFYTQHLSERGAERLSLESQLRRALENDEFVLHYQPKVDTQKRQLTGVEALLRWQSPEQGLVAPGKLIPLMEETGLIVEVGAWALRQACLDRVRWLESGLQPPRIAVNVSPVQLRGNDFVRMVKNTLRAVGMDAGIDIEVTESIIMQDADENIAKLVALRDLGVRIAIDDFGIGYSSLGYLTKLPVEVLKIDRSFVASMLDNPGDMTLVSTIISLAHALRLEVIAEGVESEDQAKILRLLHCDQIQGFLISRPLPFDEMTAPLRQPRVQ